MKKLPNKSLEWIDALTAEEALEYKNRFVCYEYKKNIAVLTFFLNPNQSYHKHMGSATRKLNDMLDKGCFAGYKANANRTMIEARYSPNKNLRIYTFGIGNYTQV